MEIKEKMILALKPGSAIKVSENGRDYLTVITMFYKCRDGHRVIKVMRLL